MEMCKRGTFINDVPNMRITSGLVVIEADAGDYVMLPSTFRAYCEQARRLLAEWDADQRPAIPLRRRAS